MPRTPGSDAVADRQRKLDELVRRELVAFVGREMTPYLMVEAETKMRGALDDAIRAGTYVLPDGLVLDRVELGGDMRVKVYFKYTVGRFDAVVEEIFSVEN